MTLQENDTIRTFFDHLKFGEDSEPVVDEISFGKLMNILEFNQRWVYRGSTTSPPCSEGVYWNVLKRVLPITPEAYAKYQEHLAKQNPRILHTGSNRKI